MEHKHWHVQSGLTGYGPEAPDHGFTRYEEPTEVADAAQDELNQWSESERALAEQYARQADYKAAWQLNEHSLSLFYLAATFDNSRADAPLYAASPELWDETIIKLVAENFPHDVNEGRARIYVWECEKTECSDDDEDNE